RRVREYRQRTDRVALADLNVVPDLRDGAPFEVDPRERRTCGAGAGGHAVGIGGNVLNRRREDIDGVCPVYRCPVQNLRMRGAAVAEYHHRRTDAYEAGSSRNR